MTETNNSVLQEDLEALVNAADFSAYQGKTVLITGATGLIGSRLVLALLCANRLKNAGIRVLALVRNPQKAAGIFGDLLTRNEFSLLEGDVTSPIQTDQKIDFIIHCASVTASKMMVEKPVETIFTSINGTRNILDLACAKQVSSMVYISSMEMYGSFEQETTVTEECLGYINPLAVRSNYPESKRMCENMCVAYCKEYGVPVKIARLAQVFGAGVLPSENRVFAQFAKSAINGTDIILHTKGESDGNYCYLKDTLAALLLLLAKGQNGDACNIANEAAHTTIAGMAHLVADRIADGKIQVVFDIPESNIYGYAKDTKMTLSSARMRSLGWAPTVDLEEAYRRMIRGMLEDGIH